MKLHLLLPIVSCHSHYFLNLPPLLQPTTLYLWKNRLPRHWYPAPKKCSEAKVSQLCPTLCDIVHGVLQARILVVGNRSLLQGIFPTQGWNPGVPHYRWILYQLSLMFTTEQKCSGLKFLPAFSISRDLGKLMFVTEFST